MAINIVEEVTTALKDKTATVLPTFKQLDYEHDLTNNNDTAYAKRYGVIPLEASSASGGAMGFTTVDHEFQLILSDDFTNKDEDVAQSTKMNALYAEAYGLIALFQKKPIPLPTVGYSVRNIAFESIDLPEFVGDNGTVAIRLNFIVKYCFKNIC